MVHGLGGGFGFASEEATLEGIKERRSNDIVAGIYMILSARVVLSASSLMSEVAAMMMRTNVRRWGRASECCAWTISKCTVGYT